jgi:hypothetical protein
MAYCDLQNRAPKTILLPDGRLRVTYVFDVLNSTAKTPAGLEAEVFIDRGSPDIKFPDCYLVQQTVTGQIENPFDKPVDRPPQLVREYEQLNGLFETPIGNADVVVGQDDLFTVRQEYWQLSAGTAIYQIPGTTVGPTIPNVPTTILKTEERTDDGTLRKIKRTYISAGEISTETTEKYNGKLTLKTLTYVDEVPPTPSGFILVNAKIDYPMGLPVYTYSFAKGDGEISRTTEYLVSADEGVNGITETTVKYLSDPSVVVSPITQPAGSVLMSVEPADSDGYRIWTATFAKGQGIIHRETEIRNNGLLYIYKIVSLNAVPTAPSPTIGGTVTLISTEQRNGSRFDPGSILYTYSWAEGKGLIEQNIVVHGEGEFSGLQDVTWVSLGTKQTPTNGPVIRDEYAQENGVTKYTVTVRQAAGGAGDPSSITKVSTRYQNFRHPGRAAPYKHSVGVWGGALDVFLSPPIDVFIPHTITVTYQTSSSIGSVGTVWNPLSWATMVADWVGLGDYPQSKITGYRDYRAYPSPGASASMTAGSLDTNGGTCLGQSVYGGSHANIAVYGGPADPAGTLWTVEADLKPVFQDATGTQWYRKTVVTCTPPALDGISAYLS